VDAAPEIFTMKPILNPIVCDGCGQPASPEHIAARVHRLELATRFRPIHVGILFVAMAPHALLEDDFYNVENRSNGSARLLTVLGIPSPAGDRVTSSANSEGATTRLNEFQHRGHYLTYLSECPLTVSSEDGRTLAGQLERWASTLVKRIQFNYKPKHVALLGADLRPVIQILRQAGLGELLLLDKSAPLTMPEPGDVESESRFQEALSERTSGSSSTAVV
jgi:hypothetical protein